MSDPTPRPRHCTDPDIHGPHAYGGDEAMLHCPGSGLRDRIADALTSAAMHPDPDADWADAVMGVVGPEIAERDAALARARQQHPARTLPFISGRKTICQTCGVPHPCPTIRAIDGSTDE